MTKFLYRFPIQTKKVETTTTLDKVIVSKKSYEISDLSPQQQVTINKLIKKLKKDKKDFVTSSDLNYYYIKSK